jgi:protein ImuB
VGVRTLAVWCPDWPVTAAGHAQDEPVAVLADGLVIACSHAARAEGVTPGLRRRQAESRCSGLLVVEADPSRDARAFEPVLAAVETAAPAVEVLRPGLCALPARGPARYYGSEASALNWVTEAVERTTGLGGCKVGIACGLFAACQAAREGRIVPDGMSAAFLAELPVDVLDAPDLADRFRRLGLRTLGAVAALPVGAMVERFGREGARAHRLARGVDERPLLPRVPPPELAVAMGFDPPADRLDVVLFAARQLAAELAERLQEHVLGCTLLAIEAETPAGRTLVRRWRHEDGLTPDALAERVRWQVEAWLIRSGSEASGHGASSGGPEGAPALEGGFARLRLVPELVHPERGRQLGFWGDRPADGRAARALARMQGMLGAGAVTTAVTSGGRTPSARIRLIPWGEMRPPGEAAEPAPKARRTARDPERPSWPGRIPSPAPATVHPVPAAVAVVDASGSAVTVDERGSVSARPAALRRPGAAQAGVVAWAGPWPADERWWDAASRCRRSRMQVLTETGTAHLLAFDGDRWLLEATYD